MFQLIKGLSGLWLGSVVFGLGVIAEVIFGALWLLKFELAMPAKTLAAYALIPVGIGLALMVQGALKSVSVLRAAREEKR